MAAAFDVGGGEEQVQCNRSWKMVSWKPSRVGWVKVNLDGLVRGQEFSALLRDYSVN